jgi:protein N-terminal amidase
MYSEISKMLNNNKDVLNVIIVQYCPVPRKVDENIKKIETLLSQYTSNDEIDIVLFPEMALTGYIFDDKKDIEPYLEEYNKGITYNFCSKLAVKLGCYVFCGYPEKCVENDSECLYNSCMIVDRSGEPLLSYRKHFLYEMDKTWCVEGKNFGTLEIVSRKGKKVKLGIGICMDLNPWEFKALWKEMEFSTFCYDNQVDLILFLTNWLDSEVNSVGEEAILRTINYWLMRLEPFLERKLKRNLHFLAANRCGKERETTFVGCSCAIKIYNGKPILIDNMNKLEESTRLIECIL